MCTSCKNSTLCTCPCKELSDCTGCCKSSSHEERSSQEDVDEEKIMLERRTSADGDDELGEVNKVSYVDEVVHFQKN